MTEFGQTLQQILEHQNVSQRHFADAIGAQSSAVSRYVKGTSLPERTTFARICETLPDHQLSLTVAYLRDHIPPTAADRITIIISDPSSGVRVAENTPLTQLDKIPGAQITFQALAQACIDTPSTLKHLQSLLDLIDRSPRS